MHLDSFGRREIVEEEEDKVHISPTTYKAAPMEAEELSVKTLNLCCSVL